MDAAACSRCSRISARRRATERRSPAAVARRAAPLLRLGVAQGLGERPAVPGGVLGRVLALAVLAVGRLHEDPRPAGARVLAVGARVVQANHDGVGLRAVARRAAFAADVAADQRAVAVAELRPVVLADLDALDEAEGVLEERDRGAHVGIDEHRDDRRRWDRAVSSHDSTLWAASNARSTTSGVTSAMPSTVTAASASASGAGGNARIGTATTAMPAAAPARSPLLAAPTATPRAGSTPSRRAASRKTSGAGLPRATSSLDTHARMTPSRPDSSSTSAITGAFEDDARPSGQRSPSARTASTAPGSRAPPPPRP